MVIQNNQHRCFLAIPLPELIKQQIAGFHKEKIKGLRWVDLDHLHITLCFIGDINQDQIHALHSLLQTITFQPFDIKTGRLGTFSRKGKIFVMWLGIEESDELNQLQKQVYRACVHVIQQTNRQNNERQLSKRKYKPHATIARIKNASHKEVKRIMNYHFKSSLRIEVNHLSLFESFLSSQGPQYSILRTYYSQDK